MDLKQKRISLLWLKLFALASILAVSFSGGASENESKREIKNFKNIKQKPWYTKMDYFVSVRRDFVSIAMPKTIEPDSDLFTIDSDPTDLSFTAGGNLFNRTSIYTEIVTNSNLYKYNQANPQIQVKSRELRGDILVEHDFGKGITLGFDLYYADRSDAYLIEYQTYDQNIVQKYTDNVKVFGGDLMTSRTFKFDASDVRLDYNFSYWQSSVNNVDVSRKFHNVGLSLSKQWSHNISTILSSQLVYFPGDFFALTEHIDIVYMLAAETRYRLGDATEVAVGLERLNFGDSSHINTLSFRFEYQFGVKKSNRRKRRYKIPKPLFRIRGLLHSA
jgi:hypothetical protein